MHLLKRVMANPAVTTVQSATSNPAHAAENVGALRGPLPDQAITPAWYPDKQAMYQGVVRPSHGQLHKRLA